LFGSSRKKRPEPALEQGLLPAPAPSPTHKTVSSPSPSRTETVRGPRRLAEVIDEPSGAGC
jgi:hypothetical protein